MCGRYKQLTDLQSFLELYGLKTVPGAPLPTPTETHATPGQSLPVIRAGEDNTVTISPLFWGFVPHWAQEDLGTKIINARAETAAEKPSFRQSFRQRRCLVGVESFFEWDRSQKPVQAYEIRAANDRPMAFAGLWDEWVNPQGGAVKQSFTLLTAPACAALAPIHHRRPVILQTPEDAARWLGAETDDAQLHRLMAAESPLTLTPVALPPRKAANSEAAENKAQLALF
jgi:putative SOS response-associated peptidase YedK